MEDHNVFDELKRQAFVERKMEPAIRTRSCTVCGRKIHPKEVHLVLPKGGYSSIKVCPRCLKIALRLSKEVKDVQG